MSSIDASSSTVQQEAERERAGLVSTLDQIRENLRPANVIDEVMANAKLSTADISDKVWSTARSNPIPAVLIGLGAAMLLGVGTKVAANRSGKGTFASSQDEYSTSQASIIHSSTLSTASTPPSSSVRNRVNQGLDAASSRASDAVTKISESASSLRRQASRKVGANSAAARDGLGSVSNEATMTHYSKTRRTVMSSLSNLLDEQPLVLAALGVAVGAAIGAAIPSTEVETRFMGEASGSVKQSAQDLAQQQFQQLKTTAGETFEDLKKTAVDHGVSKENLMGLVQDVGGKVRNAANDVVSHAADATNTKTS